MIAPIYPVGFFVGFNPMGLIGSINRKPYVRSNPGDGYVPLTCSSDAQCPRGTRCYVPKNNPKSLNNGICVVIYDKKLLKTVDPEIW